ncbi:CehA/McbA family metallohydrolase [Mycobacterium sp. CVI_P3]|uniref:CehA/McbA family metallohydrolase n=1 Tax=Mycobacterium pinniadriaticum TaxID=2994102 RepID=A0ABT3SBM1_9MYCO|nr:CehA/McbA family metallohydrolase [Mycobacterium pinniadriaticum]MCX2930479.1 CehA/McbA family metallohydrolase [Mycobacterium pinniadriaticum]MCX2936903.1 CehA/McbA family metallohydrolase [Mycobacterium pinniadriaticum]
MLLEPNVFERSGQWLRCALHAHSTVSDGDLAPKALARQYATAGFDVLAITDHWRLATVDDDQGILMVPGAELTADLGRVGWTADVLVYGIHDIPDDPGGDRRNWMVDTEEHWEQRTFPSVEDCAAWAHQQGGVAYVAHPYWTGAGSDAFDDAPHLAGIEIFNGSGEYEGGRGDSSLLWDEALQRGLRLHGIATDDTHMPLLDIGLAWTWVKVAERTPEAIVGALRNGDSYGSTGPSIFEVHSVDNGIEVRCSPARSVHVTTSREEGASVTAGRAGRRTGKILDSDGTGLITRALVEFDWAKVDYARVRVVDAAGHQAWTNVL